MYMEAFKALPEPAKAGSLAALFGAGLAYGMGESDSLLSYSLGYGAVTAVASYAAPMLTLDPMYQVGATGALGAASQFVAPAYVPGGMLMAAALPAASLYASRSFAS
jgi:hypothetical protein